MRRLFVQAEGIVGRMGRLHQSARARFRDHHMILQARTPNSSHHLGCVDAPLKNCRSLTGALREGAATQQAYAHRGLDFRMVLAPGFPSLRLSK
jgi:hypothetical protein